MEEKQENLRGTEKVLKRSEGVKRCPKCKLVHSDSDVVCRRCGVDLLTGEPVKIVRVKKKPVNEVMVERFKDMFSVLRKPFSSMRSFLERVLKRIKLPGFGRMESEQRKALIYCMECGGEMRMISVPYYSRKVVYPFLGLSLVLFGLGFIFRLLFISSFLSLIVFVVYFRLRDEFYRCSDCGAYLRRKRRKKEESGQGIETRSV